MAEYPVYANWNGREGGSCYDVPVDATVGYFIKEILQTDRVVSFGKIKLNALVADTPLADIGLGSQVTVSIDPFISRDVYNERWFKTIKEVAANIRQPNWSNIYNNPNLTTKVVLDNLDFPWDYKILAQHNRLYTVFENSRVIIFANTWKYLSENSCISVDFIKRNINEPLVWKELLTRRDVNEFFDVVPVNGKYYHASKNPYLSLDFVLEKPYMSWCYWYISNVNENWNKEYLEAFAHMPLSWYNLTKFIDSEEMLDKYSNRSLNWINLSSSSFITIEIVRKYKDKPWNLELIRNPNLFAYFREIIDMLSVAKKWCWTSITRTIPSISLEFLKEHSEYPWAWGAMSSRKDINMEIVNYYIKKKWNWRALTRNTAISLSEKRDVYIDKRVWKWPDYILRNMTNASTLSPTDEHQCDTFEDIFRINMNPANRQQLIRRKIYRERLSFVDLYNMTEFSDTAQKDVLSVFLNDHVLNSSSIKIELLFTMMEKHPSLSWHAHTLATHKDLPFEYILVNHSTLSFKHICEYNANIEKLIEYFPHIIIWDEVAKNKYITLDFLRRHYGRAITKMHHIYRNFDNTIEFIREFPLTRDNFDVNLLLQNDNLTLETIMSIKTLIALDKFTLLLNCRFDTEKNNLCGYIDDDEDDFPLEGA